MMMKFLKRLQRVRFWLLASAVIGLPSLAAAQVETATSTPTKVYATAGGAFSFVVSYTGAEVAVTDLVVTYTANTTSPTITPFATTCIPGAFTPPYNSTNPNEFYLNWEPSSGSYPLSCGGAAAAAAMATFNGVASTFVGGKYTIVVTNNASLAAPNLAANDVTVCQKRTVQSVTPPAAFVEGGGGNFVITLDAAVVAGCGGFNVPYTLGGAALAGKGASPVSGTCSFADAATTCNVAVTTVDNATFEGPQALVLTVTDSTAASSYVSVGKNASVTVGENDAAPVVSAPTVNPLTALTLTGGAGSLPVTVATAGAGVGSSLGLACSIPSGTASFAVATGANRTINAPATLGANAPNIGLTCTPQPTLQTSTLSCTQTASPLPSPAALTALITCPAAVPAIAATTPPGAVTLPGYQPGVAGPGTSSTTLAFSATGGAAALTCTAGGVGYTATPSPLNLAAGATGSVTVTYTGTVAGTFPGTLNCTSTAPATGGPFAYTLSTNVTAFVPPEATVAVPTMGAFGLGLMGLLVAGFGALVQRRRIG
jgi:hypothetical protein